MAHEEVCDPVALAIDPCFGSEIYYRNKMLVIERQLITVVDPT